MNYAPTYANDADYTNDRALLMRRVYAHLAIALLGFVALESFMLSIPSLRLASLSLMQGRLTWLMVLMAFMGISHFADKMACSQASRGTQYLGLSLYVVIEAIIFLPLLSIVLRHEFGEAILIKSSLITGGLFLGLSTVALTTRHDLSFMKTFLKVAGWVALGIIVASMLFGFSLGVIFMSAMVLLMGGCILYKTQEIQRNWPGHMFVAAALHLFSAFATMLWYVIQLVLGNSRD